MNVLRPLGLVTLLALIPITVGAAIFPDVPDSHLYREAIERLVGAQVINGHPDGTFRPEDDVNRAAMLKMLYKASGKTPDPSNVACFPDVEPGSWYEPFVCDAAANRFVQGYNDGTFKPDRNVSRAEAIKMITTVLGIAVPELTDINREILRFVDVSTAGWYTKYLSAAFSKGILPIAGQAGPRFYPDWPLLRGEAAAYLYNGLNVKVAEDREEVEEELQIEEQVEEQQRVQFTQASSSSQAPQAIVKDVTFPFTDTARFEEKTPSSYRFTLSSPAVVETSVMLTKGATGKVSCRLYRLGEGGISTEYYLGYQESTACYLRTALTAGNFQLQLQPTEADAEYRVETKVGLGDSNDGFFQAKKIVIGNLRTEVLDSGDLEDWFTFTLMKETELTLKIVSSATPRCLIYPMADVDLFGFSGPQCQQPYLYPSGTYVVGVGHASPRGARQTYTIQLK